jgi:hypothetical protein
MMMRMWEAVAVREVVGQMMMSSSSPGRGQMRWLLSMTPGQRMVSGRGVWMDGED